MRSILSLALAAVAAAQLVACKDSPLPTRPPEAGPNKLLTVGGPIIYPSWNLIYPIVDITAGSNHTCVRKSNGAVSCWGWNNSGQVGVPTTTICANGAGTCAPQPVTVTGSAGAPNFTSAKAITAGVQHTCALDGGGAAWCWGDGSVGAVGNGSTNPPSGNVTSPVLVAGGMTYQALAAGGEGTCGSSTSGSLLCWGFFPSGPTGLTGALSPMLVVNFGFSALTMSADHVCGDVGTTMWACFGSNSVGQLGTDTTYTRWATPNAEVAINGVSHVAVANSITCVDSTSGVVQCFGENKSNQYATFGYLGNPSFTGLSTFRPQTVGMLHGVVTSGAHSCALDASGNAWCWGNGSFGELGNGSTAGSSKPVMVLGGHTFSALAVGAGHSCGIGTDNHVYCWGDNHFSQLGQPSTPINGASIPVQVVQP